MSLAYRPAEPPDIVFVVSSWLSSFRGAHAAGLINMADWPQVMTPQIQQVLNRPGCQTYVAYAPNERDHISDLYGWMACEPDNDVPLVHYVYIKRAYRKMGIARGLMATAGIDPYEPYAYTCKTATLNSLRQKMPFARWSPLTARYDKAQTNGAREHGESESSEETRPGRPPGVPNRGRR